MSTLNPELYAKALLSSIHGAPKEKAHEIVRRFVRVLAKRGLAGRFPDIVRAVRTKQVKDIGGKLALVESARPLDKKVEDRFRRAFHARDLVTFAVRSSLVAGVRVTVNEEKELDLSAKKLLEDLLPQE